MALADTQITDHTNTASATGEAALAVRIIFTVLVALLAWGMSVFTWGIPGLYLPALAMVPVIYLLLIVIAKG